MHSTFRRRRKDWENSRASFRQEEPAGLRCFNHSRSSQPTGEIRVNGVMTQTHTPTHTHTHVRGAGGWGEGPPNRVISSCRWTPPPFFPCAFNFLLPASLSVHMLYVLGGPEGSAESWVHPALFHQVLRVKKEQPYILVWLLHPGSMRRSLKGRKAMAMFYLFFHLVY